MTVMTDYQEAKLVDRYVGTSTNGHRRLDDGRSSPTYNSWRAMVLRCRNPNRRDFKWYGERGIQVCPQWLTPPTGTGGFSQFLEDMGPRPEGTTLDRIDVHGHYEPGNCRWASKEVQANNQRGTLMANQGLLASMDDDDRWEPSDWAVQPKWPELTILRDQPVRADDLDLPF